MHKKNKSKRDSISYAILFCVVACVFALFYRGYEYSVITTEQLAALVVVFLGVFPALVLESKPKQKS